VNDTGVNRYYSAEFENLRREVEQAIGSSGSEYVFVDSFCGAGGMSVGLKQAGFAQGLAFDIDGPAIATHQKNVHGKAYVADVREITGSRLCSELKIGKRELDLFAGGPPCQGFSKQKRGAHLGDQRNDLVVEYIRLVDELSPRFFLFENVAIFGQKRGKQYVARMHEELTEYEILPEFVNSACFGLPQTRERYLIVGRRRDVDVSFGFPKNIVTKNLTVGNALNGLPEPPADYTVHPKYPNHQNARVTELNIERFSHVQEGGGWRDIPEEMRLPCHQRVDSSKGGWPDVYGRLEWDGQCPTITGGFDSFTRGRYGHPKKDRPLTPREAARIQGFDDGFAFIGTRGDVRKQIGNAVPPPVAYAVGTNILRSLLVADGVLKENAPKLTFCEELGAYETGRG